MAKDYIYELKHPFDYAYKGDNQAASFISMTAPTFKQIAFITPIKQAFVSAISEITVDAVDQVEDNSPDIEGAQVMQLMYRWSGDMTGIFLHAEQLFKSGAALVDGEVKLTTPLMEKMSADDFEGLLGDYIANFITPSLMGGTPKSTG